MNRAKRKALLKLLRNRPITADRFRSVAITPELAAKLATPEWLEVWENHVLRQHGKSGMQREFIDAELRKTLKAVDKDVEFNFYWLPDVPHHDLNDIPPDLSITFAKSTDMSEGVRTMARKWLEDNFLRRKLGEEMISTAEYADRKALSRRGGKPAPVYEPQSMDEFVANITKRIKELNPSVHQPTPAIDACGIDLCISKESLERINKLVREHGLVKAFEYQPTPAKPAEYTEYCARQALNELEKDDEE